MARTKSSQRNTVVRPIVTNFKAHNHAKIESFRALVRRERDARYHSPIMGPMDALMSNGAENFNALLAVASQEFQAEEEEKPSLKMQMAMDSVVHEYDYISQRSIVSPPQRSIVSPPQRLIVSSSFGELDLSDHIDRDIFILTTTPGAL